MASPFRFDSLPNEIYGLVHENLNDHKALLALVLVSKHCYAVFNRYLYEFADDSMLFTLALSDKDRLPLTKPHPASFVRDLSFVLFTSGEEAEAEDEVRIEADRNDEVKCEKQRKGPITSSLEFDTLKQVTSALKNITALATARLRCFEFRADVITLPEAFGSVDDMSIFRSLEELDLGCPLPGSNLQQSLRVYNHLCTCALTSLELDFSHVEHVDSWTLACILEQTAKNCPNLMKLLLALPEFSQDEPSQNVLQSVFDGSITFPCLNVFSLQPYTNDLDFTDFFQRHPHVERVGYLYGVDTLSYGKLSGLFPNLRRFEGYIPDFISLSLDNQLRPIEDIALFVFDTFHNIGEGALVDALAQSNQTIRRLLLKDESLDWWNAGMSWGLIDALMRACPKLTCVECPLDFQGSQDLCLSHAQPLFSSLFCHVPQLEHLRLVMRSSAPFHDLPDSHKDLLGLESISTCPRSLKTAQFHVQYSSGRREEFNFTRAKPGSRFAPAPVPPSESDYNVFDSMFMKP
ncbi:hypothetical protein GYMLUDRAFT_35865 [Collybiopsis luxurians FD-317 M1]|nr:hypothetical protein GYMLUDRAFT_35865 [Collybiopsis luxurians FD-317 M1]